MKALEKKRLASGPSMKSLSLLWHDKNFHLNRFEPILSSDYFCFIHEKDEGIAEVVGTLVDGVGRIVFNLVCSKCGFHDALKIAPNPIYFSPKMIARIDRRGWFDANKLSEAERRDNTEDHRRIVIDLPELVSCGLGTTRIPEFYHTHESPMQPERSRIIFG